MNAKLRLLVWALVLATVGAIPGDAAGQDPSKDEARGGFLKTRVRASPPRPSRSRAKSAPVEPASPAGSTHPLGLAYTLYRADVRGLAVRVDAEQVFYSEDRLRAVIESNTDGYLYVFTTENDGEPEMIYPDERLESGENRVRAHVPVEVPSSGEPNPENRWFRVYGAPATERLYVVTSREPIPGVPTGKGLVDYCKAYPGECPWRPTPEIWNAILKYAREGAQVSRSKTFGQRQSAVEQDAIARKIGLRRDAPEPTVVYLNQSLAAGVVVAVLALAHR
jgi:hypothetical protein